MNFDFAIVVIIKSTIIISILIEIESNHQYSVHI